jgi:four helix bundle protein
MAGWKSVKEIVAYQRAVSLRDQIIRLTEEGEVTRDFKFRADIRGSAASATNNLAAGFDRYNHGEFAHLSSIAKASLGETRNHLVDGQQRGYFTKEDVRRLDHLADRAMAATVGLIKYLRRTKAPDPYWLHAPDEPAQKNRSCPPAQTDPPTEKSSNEAADTP